MIINFIAKIFPEKMDESSEKLKVLNMISVKNVWLNTMEFTNVSKIILDIYKLSISFKNIFNISNLNCRSQRTQLADNMAFSRSPLIK